MNANFTDVFQLALLLMAKKKCSSSVVVNHYGLIYFSSVELAVFGLQVESGAQLLQVFESSADHLTREQFIEFSAPYLKDIRSGVKKAIDEKSLEQVPMVM